MKYIKEYETIENQLNDGDYVICYYDKLARYAYHAELTDELKEFINNNVGRINIVSRVQYTWIDVSYENIPYNLMNKFSDINSILLTKDAVVDTSPDKEELEVKLSANKYNL